MAHIPQVVLDRCPVLAGLPLRNRGKVRDSYDIPGRPDLMMPYVSDRISIRDFVLPCIVSQKGEILNALSIFLTREVISQICETDLVASGRDIDQLLQPDQRGNVDWQKRATVVKLLTPADVEDVVRLYMFGSGFPDYQQTGMINVHRLPPGLLNGSKLPFPIYDPTTKAAVGHDKRISADEVAKTHGFKRERLALQIAQAISDYAWSRGVIFVDTKFEFSGDFLTDEKGTPDSSRYWSRSGWEKAMANGKTPPSLDKQFVRDALDHLVKGLDPEKPEDLAKVDALIVPEYVPVMTRLIYRYLFWLLVGKKLETFQRQDMGIDVSDPKLHTEIVVGSKNDLLQLDSGLTFLAQYGCSFNVSVMSCHRNADQLPDFVKEVLCKADRVVACAGKAAALPGIVKSLLCLQGRSDIPVIGVALKGETTEDDRDATGSIKGLPGQPVELDPKGEAYFGSYGFSKALEAALWNEFLPKKVEHKPADVGIRHS